MSVPPVPRADAEIGREVVHAMVNGKVITTIKDLDTKKEIS